MKRKDQYRPLRKYRQHNDTIISTMENYMEFLSILSKEKKRVHRKDIESQLEVSEEYVASMTDFLKEEGFIHEEKQGSISLTLRGKELGDYYLYRHDLVHKFLSWACDEELLWEDTDKMEHLFSDHMIQNIEKYVKEHEIITEEGKNENGSLS